MRLRVSLLAFVALACGGPDSAPEAAQPPLSPTELATMPEIEQISLAWPRDSQPFGPVRLAVSPMGTLAILDPGGGPPFLTLRDSTGKLVARVGRAGEGPGELTGMGQLLASGDEFVVLDDGRGAVVRYAAQDGDYVGEDPLRVPGFALGIVGDSIDIFDAEFAFRGTPPAVVRHAISETGSRTVVSDSNALFRQALGLPLASRRPIPPPAWFADASTTIWGDGRSYEMLSVSSSGSDTVRINRELDPNVRGPLGRRMMRAAIEASPQSMRGPQGQEIRLPEVASRLDTLDRETVPYFSASGIGTDAAGRVVVAGMAGDSAFIDVFAGVAFLGRKTLDCFTPVWVSINRGWVAIQCRDRDEENRSYTIQLYRLVGASS